MTKNKMNLIWKAIAYYLTELEDPDTFEYQEGQRKKELLEAWYTLREKFPHLELD